MSTPTLPIAIPPDLHEPPSGWRWLKLNEAARLESGHTPSRLRPDWWGGDVSWLSLTEIRALDGQWVESTQLRTNEHGIANSAARILPRGTVCLSRTASVGFVTIMAKPMTTSQDFANWVCGEDIDPEYLMYALICSRSRLRELATGATHKTIYMPLLEAFHLCAPDVAEQRRIAKRLRAQLAEVDCARQAMKAQTSDIALLRRSVLRAAFDALLDRYDRDVCLKDVCSISAGGTPSRGAVAFFNGSIPWVKTLDLNFGIVTDTEEKISQQALLSIRGELLPVGTVLVAMYGGAGTIGKSGILGIEACTNQAICAMKPKADELDSAFLHEWLCYIRPEWMRLAGGNRKDPNINKSIVENMTLPLPPLDEQCVFAKRLKLQLAEVNVIAETAAAQLSELSRLPQRLLAQAFEN